MNVDIETIIRQAKSYNPTSDSDKIRAAYQLAAEAHAGQLRDSGEPYISHPLAVAEILTTLQTDDTTIIASLLHDVIEDTEVPSEQIEERFGHDVLMLVDGVTKLSKLQFHTRHEAQAENLRKMFIAMSSDIRIILIKLADRLHNMRTLRSHHSQLRQKEIAEETLTIFAPLAHRLGIFRIKNELEDISIEILEPEAIANLKKQLAEEQETRERFINSHCEIIRTMMEKAGIKAEVKGRTKNYYSIYNKMQRQQKELREIFDLNAIRIIVDTVRDCYAALGIIHSRWKPIPGRFKDYIAMPKQNMYQSLHTTLVAHNGSPFEVQIRTWEMHRIAEYGIAAHWKYKQDGASTNNTGDSSQNKIEWLRQMLEWQKDMGDSQEFMETVKGDLFKENIYVFSPAGDVYELPQGSIPLDFAYRVHTQIGHKCVGAKVNQRLVPLDTPLNNGDIVEILTANGRGPSRDWLKIVKTQQAKSRIRQWFRKEQREESILLGKEALERECKKYNLDPETLIKPEKMQELAKRFNVATGDDLYAALGDGALKAETVLTKIKADYKKTLPPKVEIQPERQNISHDNAVVVQGVADVMVRLASCCKPLPGDEIIGYITRGRGISVHRVDCSNARRYMETEADRLIEVHWGNNTTGIYQVEMEVICHDRERLLMDILAIMAETKTTVNGVHVTVDRKRQQSTVYLKIEIKSLDQFDYLRQKVSRIKGVIDAHRLVNSGETHHKNKTLPQ